MATRPIEQENLLGAKALAEKARCIPPRRLQGIHVQQRHLLTGMIARILIKINLENDEWHAGFIMIKQSPRRPGVLFVWDLMGDLGSFFSLLHSQKICDDMRRLHKA